MKALVTNLRNTAISGVFFMLPIIVIFIIANKAWVSLTSVGANIAGVFGMKAFLGVGATTIFTGLVLIGLVMLLGILARYAFMARFREYLERLLSQYLPGYSAYKLSAEDKLQSKLRMLPYASALIRQKEYWQPAYVIERGQDDYCVVFIPDVPDTGRGEVLVAKSDQIRLLPAVSVNDLDASLRRIGKGLLSALQLRDH
jgi:uncharacterized membrane protein